MNQHKKLRVGIAGYGIVGRRRRACIERSDSMQVAAVCDRTFADESGSVDGVRAYVGSENLSYTSLNKNREIGVIAYETDILATMAQTFSGDWAVSALF